MHLKEELIRTQSNKQNSEQWSQFDRCVIYILLCPKTSQIWTNVWPVLRRWLKCFDIKEDPLNCAQQSDLLRLHAERHRERRARASLNKLVFLYP